MLYLFCISIAVASLLGGVVPLLIKPTHRRMQLAMSFIAGVMAGVAVLDILPEALKFGETKEVLLWLLAGFLTIFLVERFLPSHCHDVAQDNPEQTCGHEHQLTWIGTCGGLTLHSLLAGIALAAAWGAGGMGVALGVFVAIVLHKPFDGLTLIAMMRIAKIHPTKTHIANVLFSFSVPLGVVMFQFGGDLGDGTIAAALAFSAGMFLCISLSDLLPELQFHGHDKIALTLALLLGLGAAWGVSQLHHDDHTETILQVTIYDADNTQL